ncbi:MAG: hypothetical protein HY759_00065 [Nitrospirae bacterium]|nr:hypothetical protein [Nitrospirota bacterium]
MQCKDVQKELVNYYYNEVSNVIKSAVDEHLEYCNNCASSLEKLKNTLDGIKIEEPVLTDVFWERYSQKVYKKVDGRELRQERKFRLFRLPRLIPAAAAAIVLLTAFWGSVKLYESKQENTFISRNYDLINNLELFEEYELLQNLQEIEAVEKT